MFCLRIWLLPLFFLSNASPLYLILFLTATYILQRPCVYCSLLLAVLVLSLFDFRSNWFEPREVSSTYDAAITSFNASTPLQELFDNGTTFLASAFNATPDIVKSLTSSQAQINSSAGISWSFLGLEWVRNAAGKRELHIPHVNAIIRL